MQMLHCCLHCSQTCHAPSRNSGAPLLLLLSSSVPYIHTSHHPPPPGRDPKYDGLFEVPTLAEYLAVAKVSSGGLRQGPARTGARAA